MVPSCMPGAHGCLMSVCCLLLLFLTDSIITISFLFCDSVDALFYSCIDPRTPVAVL